MTALPTSAALPPTFTSAYRLFLRATSASVLHHNVARKQLRLLWRPHFREAAKVLHTLRDPGLSVQERNRREEWMAKWETGVDHTLSFLATSSTSRGLPHNITRALSFLNYGYHTWNTERLYGNSHTWNPSPEKYKNVHEQLQQIQRAEIIAKRKAERRAQEGNRDKVEQAAKKWDGEGWGALEEVARMAEGTTGVFMGRVEVRKRRASDTHRPGRTWAR